MLLLIVVLLFIAALTVAVRVVESKNAFGFALVVLAALIVGHHAAWKIARTEGVDQSHSLTRAAVAQEADDELADAEKSDKGTADKKPGKKGGRKKEADEQTSKEQEKADTTKGEEAAGDDIEISVDSEPGEVVIPPRPDWVEADPVLEGDVHVMSVPSGLHEFERECRRELDNQLEKAVAEYIDFYLGKVYGDQFKASTFVHYDLDYIKNHLVKETYNEVIQVSFGPMHQSHARLEFDKAFQADLDSHRDDIRQQWKQMQAVGRLLGAALGFGFVLVMLGIVFGYFRLDTATRGYYTGRLQFSAGVVILAVIVAGIMLARQIPWM